MENSKLQSRQRERETWWQIRSSIARSVEPAQNLWNRKLQLNTLVFLSMRDQSNSNRTVYSTHAKTALSRWQLENSWILSRSLRGAIGSPNSAAPGRSSRNGLWGSTARALDTNRARGKAFISLGHSWAPARLVRAASPLQHHVHRVKVCPFSAQGCSTQHSTHVWAGILHEILQTG